MTELSIQRMAQRRSERGISVPFVLVLFLACTLAVSVVLGASSAASGRLVDLIPNDQRYYSVTSAAALFRDEIDAYGEIEVVVTGGSSPTLEVKQIKPDGDSSSKSGSNRLNLLEQAAICQLFQRNDAISSPSGVPVDDIRSLVSKADGSDYVWAYSDVGTSDTPWQTMSLSASGYDDESPIGKALQQVSVEARMENGNLVFDFVSGSSGDTSKLRLVCVPSDLTIEPGGDVDEYVFHVAWAPQDVYWEG